MRDEEESAEASEPIGGSPDADNVESRLRGGHQRNRPARTQKHKQRPYRKNPRTALQKVQTARNRSFSR